MSSDRAYSVVIPSNRQVEAISPLILSLVNQTFLPQEIIIVWDQRATLEEFALYHDHLYSLFHLVNHVKLRIIHPLTDQNFRIGQGASFVRNYGRAQVQTPYMIFIDDDNVVAEDFAQLIFAFIDQQVHDQAMILAPLQYDPTTSELRAALATGFNYRLSRPIWATHQLLETTDRYVPLSLASSNCLIGPTQVFASYPFDEEIPFVYEDLEMIARMRRGGIQILADTRVGVNHHHMHRSRLAEMYANTPDRLYYKTKHRLILIHTMANCHQKIQFYLT